MIAPDNPASRNQAPKREKGKGDLLARGFASICDGESLEGCEGGREAWKISEGEITVDSTDEELTP